MYVAGDPSLGLVALTCLGGFLSAGGAGAVNHYYDRDIDAQMARTADAARALGPRRAPAPRWPSASRCRRSRSLLLVDWPSTCSRAVLALCGFLGYVLVYTMWLKRSTPQNIVIGGAAGAVPPLVGWAAVTGHVEPDRLVPVRDRLLLDAAALLGAVAADEGRVRARGRADDAGRPRRDRDAPPDRALHGPAGRADDAAGRVRLLRRDLRGRGARRSARAFLVLAVRLQRRADRQSALRTYLFSLAYLALLFCAMVADARL